MKIIYRVLCVSVLSLLTWPSFAGPDQDCEEQTPPANVDRGKWLTEQELRHRNCVAYYRRELEVESVRSQIAAKRADIREAEEKGSGSSGPFMNQRSGGRVVEDATAMAPALPPASSIPTPEPMQETPNIIGVSEYRVVVAGENGRNYEVEQGETVSGWKIASIKGGLVELTRKGRSVTVRLD